MKITTTPRVLPWPSLYYPVLKSDDNIALQRAGTRQYLKRPELLPNPRGNTAWRRLYDSQADRAFITTMGVDAATFGRLLEQGFAQRWYEDPVTRPDINALSGNPRPGRRSLDAEGGLGLVLHYLNSTIGEKTLCQPERWGVGIVVVVNEEKPSASRSHDDFRALAIFG